jgi:hypothetical protein
MNQFRREVACFAGLSPILVHLSKNSQDRYSYHPISVSVLVELAKTSFATIVLLIYVGCYTLFLTMLFQILTRKFDPLSKKKKKKKANNEILRQRSVDRILECVKFKVVTSTNLMTQ